MEGKRSSCPCHLVAVRRQYRYCNPSLRIARPTLSGGSPHALWELRYRPGGSRVAGICNDISIAGSSTNLPLGDRVESEAASEYGSEDPVAIAAGRARMSSRQHVCREVERARA